MPARRPPAGLPDEKFRAAFNASPIAMSLVDPQGRFVLINEAQTRLTGHTLEEVRGHHFLELKVGADGDEASTGIAKLASGELTNLRLNRRIRHRDGHLIDVRVLISPVFDAAGRLLCLLGSLEEVDNRVSREEELAATVSLLATATEVGKVGTFVAWLTPDKVGRDEWSKTCMEIFGYDETTYDGSNAVFWRCIHPDDVAMVREAQAASHRPGGPVYDIRHRIIRRDGEERWIRERALVERDVEGNPIRFLGVTIDITEEHRAEEALRAREARNRGIFESSPIGMALFVNGLMVQVNAALGRMVGQPPAELIGQPGSVLERLGILSATVPQIGELMAGQVDHLTFERAFRQPDQTLLWGRVHLSLVVEEGVTRPAVLAQIEDITAEKQAQEELIQSRLDVEMKNRLVSMLNHEVRTPLNAIIGFTELMAAEKAGPLTDKQRRYLNNVDGSSRHLLSLVSDHLDLAKLKAGEMQVNPSVLEVQKVLEEVIGQLAPLADARGLAMGFEGGRATAVLADHRRLVQILLNLLSNSLKHTPSGGFIKVRARETGSGRVEISVVDSGRGIPADKLEDIFEEYHQVGPEDEGTGLGLPVSRRLARLMDGDLVVESVVGVGSTFTVQLPAAVAMTAEAS
jgi:PAS domain S-box-containing protein